MSPPTPAMPGSDYDLQDAAVVAGLFRDAAQANRDTPGRRGATVHLPDTGRLTMTGDLHDHLANLQRILRIAKLDKPHNHVAFHEVIHGETLVNGMDLSIRTLARLAALKIQHPEQVHLLLSNHEISQMRGDEILKNGGSVVRAFDEGAAFLYGADAEKVAEAMTEFIRSYPLVLRCANGVLCAHSLPSARKVDLFDPAILERELTEQDLQSKGGASLMVWGRNHNDKIVDELAEKLNCELFLLGHQPAEMGYEFVGGRIIVLNSDHDHGVALPFDLAKRYTQETLAELIRPLAAVATG